MRCIDDGARRRCDSNQRKHERVSDALRVQVRTSGDLVNATTTNGSITVALGSSGGDAPMRFTTTNGTVTVYAPPALSADLEMSTTNGGVSMDFPVTVSGTMSGRQIRGTLGGGGRSIIMRSTNGDVALRRNGI